MRKKHRKLRKFFSLDGYATSPVWMQLLVLVVLCTACILLFSLAIGPIKHSFFVFFDPEGWFAHTDGFWPTALGLVEFVIGFTIAAFVISLLTTALEIFISDIKAGTLPYKKSDHIIIVNENPKLVHILEEINAKYAEIKEYKETRV